MRLGLIIALTFLCGRAWAGELPDQVATAGVAEFREAYRAWDGTKFGRAASLFEKAASQAPATPLFRYWLGVAQFHLMLHAQSLPTDQTNKIAASLAMDAAVDALSQVLKLDENHAESHALLGTLYGMKINGNLLRALQYGPRVQKHSKKALLAGGENPRVRYLLGAAQFHTASNPEGWREALASLLQAEKLFEQEAGREPGPLEPRWGYSSCLTFIGRACEKLGERERAGRYLRRALVMHPADHVAREALKRIEQGLEL